MSPLLPLLPPLSLLLPVIYSHIDHVILKHPQKSIAIVFIFIIILVVVVIVVVYPQWKKTTVSVSILILSYFVQVLYNKLCWSSVSESHAEMICPSLFC